MKKLLSFKYWVHVFRRVFRLLKNPNIPIAEKLIFVLPAVVYWIIPDALPFLPIDDIAVTMLLANWFSHRMERKYGISPHAKK